MSITWFHTESNNVRDVVEQAAHALHTANEPQAEDTTPDPLALHDPYLAENVQRMRAEWSVDPWRVVASGDTLPGKLFRLGQRATRRLSWWYALPQWQQISEFQGATVRVTDTLVAHLLAMKAQMNTVANVHSEQRLRALEDQLRAAQKRIDALEAQLAAQRTSPPSTDERTHQRDLRV
jgi:hypothetical protein